MTHLRSAIFLATVGALATPVFVTDANAAVCLLRSSSGTCKMWSGSVECEDLNASRIGNITKDPKSMACSVAPTAGDPAGLTGLVFCSNGGDNVAPGAQAFLWGGEFTGSAMINDSMVTKNGFASGIDVNVKPSWEQFRELDGQCRNTNWYAIDFVPCAMAVSVAVVDEFGNVTDTKQFSCSLPQCETLTWDKFAQRPERRQYDCTEAP